jgi:uncharacterized membrane protein
LSVPAGAHLREAALLGAATGMRTCSGIGALALRRRLGGPPVRLALIASAAGELVIDKLPGVPPRIQPPQLAGRVGVGAFAGHRAAGPGGAAAGAAAALGSAFVTYHARRLLSERLPVPDPVVGAAEDVFALGCAALATR